QKIAHVHRRDAQPPDAGGDLPAFDAGNNAVAFPAPEPGRAGVAQAAFLQKDGPRTMFADVAGHAEEGATPIGARGFNEQRHTRPVENLLSVVHEIAIGAVLQTAKFGKSHLTLADEKTQ